MAKANSTSLFNKLGQQAKLAGARLADKHINLAVTGLSKSGKTAFITSLMNQLLEANENAQLPFFSSHREGRIIGVKRSAQMDVTTSRFAYDDAIEGLSAHPPRWPQSTTGISQVRLLIRYKKKRGIAKWLSEDGCLTLDITDYPGEWLLDLPLLEMDFATWCEHCAKELRESQRATLSTEVRAQIDSLDLNGSGDESQLQKIAESYAAYLKQSQLAGFQLLQPGRFLLPGELAGAPVLHFFPVSQSQLNMQNVDLTKLKKGSNIALLVERFEQYKQHVIRPFYQQHFKRFDRQIILVDCLGALNRGYHSYHDLQKALNWLMGSFAYGSSNILKRLFKPKIDKLIFAASKADHITPDQQSNLVKLLDSMLRDARKQLLFDGVVTESTLIAALKASKHGTTQVNGESVAVVQGLTEDGRSLTLFPGEVPIQCPQPSFWQKQKFEFPHFAAPQLKAGDALPHIRMDQVIDFMLADKLQ
ncbi:YcjX family protein [Paraglaciecola sp.]|uniref:YcjX family protein n=1 Tax=Paraglaciecola sp. TaxID=1920173 RepID=UPI0030F4A3C9